MPLLQRKNRGREHSPVASTEGSGKNTMPSRNWVAYGAGVSCMALMVALVTRITTGASLGTTSSANGVVFDMEPGVQIRLNLSYPPDKSSMVSLGPHIATMELKQQSCQRSPPWLRLEGDALVGVEMHEDSGGWSGSFKLPREGAYKLYWYWRGCDGKGDIQRKLVTNLVAAGSAESRVEASPAMFPHSAWISSRLFSQEDPIQQPYVWHNPTIPSNQATMLKTEESVISQEGTTHQDSKFYQFEKLSNYELVCWVGSESSDMIREAFLKLRPLLFSHQRPFKFHRYETHSFVSPDAEWADSDKTRFRKCKHVLISVDQVKVPVSQAEYAAQVKTFINHLLKAFPDETFPIWMFTVSESPMAPTNCHNPSLQSSEHPCNVALKELFRKSPFPSRVHLLDNTDITLPQLGENQESVATAIALRIFVFVGKQVQTWRAAGQMGRVDGLVRGDEVEPNFELIPYTAWN